MCFFKSIPRTDLKTLSTEKKPFETKKCYLLWQFLSGQKCLNFCFEETILSADASGLNHFGVFLPWHPPWSVSSHKFSKYLSFYSLCQTLVAKESEQTLQGDVISIPNQLSRLPAIIEKYATKSSGSLKWNGKWSPIDLAWGVKGGVTFLELRLSFLLFVGFLSSNMVANLSAAFIQLFIQPLKVFHHTIEWDPAVCPLSIMAIIWRAFVHSLLNQRSTSRCLVGSYPSLSYEHLEISQYKEELFEAIRGSIGRLVSDRFTHSPRKSERDNTAATFERTSERVVANRVSYGLWPKISSNRPIAPPQLKKIHWRRDAAKQTCCC